MKRILFFLLISGLLVTDSPAQKLLDIYKNGLVKLVPDETYGAKNNWETLFSLYYDTIGTFEQPRGNDKKIIVAPDGSVFMSHKNRHEIWKFGPDGNFVKSFGSKGGKSNQFPMLPSIHKVVDGKYVFTCDVNARMKFFDLNGNYYKSITLDYMTGDFQPLGNGQILLEGRVMWKNEESGSKYISYKWRHIIVNLNIYTGERKIIYSFFENPDFKFLNTTNRDSMQMIPVTPPGNKIYLPTPPFGLKRPTFTLLADGQFIQSSRETGEVSVFDKNGKEKARFKLDIIPVAITEQDALENYEATRSMLLKTLERAKSMPDPADTKIEGNQVKQSRNYPDKKGIIERTEFALTKIDQYKDINRYYPHLPYFSNIITDDEGNLLVFEFTSREQKESNIFNVIAYDKNGNKLSRTSFVCDDYDLSFSESTFVISKGYVYAVAKLKNYKGMPLRLVKFKLIN